MSENIVWPNRIAFLIYAAKQIAAKTFMKKTSIKIIFSDPDFVGWPMQLKIRDILSRHYTVEYSTEPDFLFYSCYGTRFKTHRHCVKIYFTGENVLPNFNDCDYAIGFDYMNFEERYLRYEPAYSYINDCMELRKKTDFSLASRKFCNLHLFPKMNEDEGTILRSDFCQALSNYKKVDCPGIILNNMTECHRTAQRELDSKKTWFHIRL